MIKIPTQALRKFVSVASEVPDTKLLPVYSYVKLVCKKSGSSIIKSNGNRFLTFDIDAEFDKEVTLMIETKPMFGFVKFCRTSEVTISINKGCVVIDDGEKTISCQTTKDLYPTIADNPKADKYSFSPEVLAALSVAKNHTLSPVDKALRPWSCYVHIRKIGDKYWVVGTRGEVTYFKGFSAELPEISLEPETISVLSKSTFLTYSSMDSYDYFEGVGFMYGFLKPETKCAPEVDNVLKNFKSNDSFEITKQPIIDFCEMVSSVNDTSVPPVIRITGNDNSHVNLSFADIADNVKASEDVRISNKTFDLTDTDFLPRNMLTVLNGSLEEDIKISYAHKSFIITSKEENYIGAIMQLG